MSLKDKNKAELITLVEQLQADDKNAALTAIQADLDAANATIAERDATIATLKEGADVSGYEKQIEQLVKENSALKETKGNSLPLMEIDGEMIQLPASIMKAGEKIDVEKLRANPDLVRAELKKGNQSFKRVGQPAEA